MNARAIYESSNGEETKAMYAALERRGAIGVIAVNLFRAQKCSARAKVYRGGIRGHGSFRHMAYDRKNWAITNLAAALGAQAQSLGIAWGWKTDDRTPGFEHVLYVDLPTGQVSFHSATRGRGPDYAGDWDGQKQSAERIIAFCDELLAAPPDPLGGHPSISSAVTSDVRPPTSSGCARSLATNLNLFPPEAA